MEFKFRTYLKRELAMMYFPGKSAATAMRRLNRWIAATGDLRGLLFPTRYFRHCSIFAPWQVRLLVQNFGEPEVW